MSGRILILGVGGRLGMAAAESFRRGGWSVSGIVRPGASARAPRGIAIFEIDAFAPAAIPRAARCQGVILQAVNLPFPNWDQYMLPLTYGVIEAAEVSGATLMFPGSLYNYGKGMPAVIDEGTPMRPSSRKGLIRVLIE